MSDTSEKMRALVLALVMVTSVFAGVVSFGGVVAAANAGNVSASADNTPGGTIPAGASNDITVVDVEYDPSGNGENVDSIVLDLGAGNDAANFDQSEIGNVTFELNGGAITSTMPYSDNVTFDPNGTVDVSNVMVTAEVLSGADGGTVIDAAYDFNSSTVASYDTQNNWTVSSERGFISGKVTTPDNDPVPNTTIRAAQEGTSFVKTTTTDSTGFYTIGLPPGTYDVTAEKTNFTSVTAKDTTVVSNKTTTANFVIEPLRFAVRLEVTPASDEALAGQSLSYTVTAYDNFGNTISGIDISATDDSPDVVYTSATTQTTDSNGQATFTVTSPDPAVATLNFTAGPNANTNGDLLWTTALAEFVPRSGNGTIPGEVKEAPDGEPLEDLEDARVWTVRLSDFNSNKQYETVDLNAELGTTNANTTTSFRLMRLDSATGVPVEVVDNDMYRVQIDEPASDVSVLKDNILNTSATAVGGGFKVTDRNGDDIVNIAVTPLERGNYTLQVHDSAKPGTTGWATVEDYINASHGPDGPVWENDPAPDYVRRQLTYEATKEVADRIDTAAYDITDVFGEYGLNDLFVDKQLGVNYVVMASKAGYSTDFADTFEWADGYYFDDANKKDIILELEPEPVTPVINITDIALLPNASAAPSDAENPAAYSEYFYADQSDAHSQVVPRTGSTIDVVLVETTADTTGEGIDSEVTLTVPDRAENGQDRDDFQGEWIGVAGGTTISEDPANDTITISTGEDGQAIAWLQTDRSAVDLGPVFGSYAGLFCDEIDGELGGFSGIYAVDPTDPTVDDATCKDFLGITQSASISGFVTDGANGGLSDTIVWTAEIDLNNQYNTTPGSPDSTLANPGDDAEFLVYPTDDGTAPADGGYSDWVVQWEGPDENFNTGDDVYDTGLSRADLMAYRFTKFPNVVSGETFTLLTTTDFNTEAKYTLPRVPARGTSLRQDEGVEYTVDAVARGSGKDGFGPARVVVNSTDDTNIVIAEALGPDFQIEDTAAEGISVSPNPATQGDTVDVTVNVTNEGDIFGDVTVTLFVDGAVRDTVDLTDVGSLDTEEVNFEIDSGTLSTGPHTIEVTTPDDSASETLTVQAPPFFEVSSLSAPSMVTKGDNVTVTADITNTGSVSATKAVEFRLGGTTLRTDMVSLNAGESTTVTFEVSTDSVAPGTYTHGVFTEDDNETAELTVGGEAVFEVSDVSAPDTPKGETLTITAMVENTGDLEGTQTIEFNVSGEDTATGSGAIDVAFVFDNSGTMSGEIDAAKASISDFTSQIEASGADARYALVSFGDTVVTEQDFTDAATIQTAIDDLGLTGGGDLPENPYTGIARVLQDLDRRTDARPVIITITDADAHYDGDGSGFTDFTRTEIATMLNDNNAKFICACVNAGSGEGNITAMTLEDLDDGTFINLEGGDFGDQLTGEIASEVTEAAGGKEITLAPGESQEVTFEVSTDELAEGEYDVTVSSDDSEASTTTNITAPSGPVERFDENGDGDIDDGELENAIVAWSAGDLDDDGLQSVIVEWSS